MKRLLFVFVVFSSFSLNAQQNLRGWHTRGQTFLVWEHGGSIPADTTFEIYTSSQPIASISNATRIGRVFANNGANSRIHGYVPDARWRLPDTLGGTVTVDTNEAYFAITPHSAGTAYYAVVLYNDTIVTSTNTVGPINETTEPVGVVIQHQDTVVTIYGHWIDGRTDYDSGRPDYLVMANEYSNGLGFDFAVWKQVVGPSPNCPLNICLHGGTDNLFLRGRLPYVARYMVPGGYFVSFDDPLPARDPWSAESMNVNTFWFGYNKNYNPFLPTFPSITDTIINYTIRRIWWETNWLLDNFSIDSNRISLFGCSMGGNGLSLITQFFPELYSSALSFVAPRATGPIYGIKYKLIGSEAQNIPTNLDGYPGIYDAFTPNWRIQNLQQDGYDWPFTIIVYGKQDALSEWSEKPLLCRQLDSAKTGFALYWDEREHENWSDTVHFRYSEHLWPLYLSLFRCDQSFPAFSGTDLDLITPGRQPDPGNGDPSDGDPWGTWGGYLEWDTESIVDTVDKWAVTMWVVYQSIYPNDIPEVDTILACVTPRRLQQFQPQMGQTYLWNFVKVSTGDTLQKGTIQADSSSIITIPDLLLIKEPVRLTIWEPVSVEENQDVNKLISLYQNYPNPFTKKTVIEFRIESSVASWFIPDKCGRQAPALQIYDLAGRLVRSFPITNYQSPIAKVVWDGKNENKKLMPSGIYFVKLKVGDFSQTKKLLLFPAMSGSR